jgi:NDP-sugar pyrophosphorylase family protein
MVYGDNLTTIDLPRFIGAHRPERLGTIALFYREDVSQSGVVELDEHGAVRSFVEKPKPGQTQSHWVNAGLVMAEPAILDFVPPSGASDFGRDIFPAILQAGRSLGGYEMSPDEGLWWIDTLDDHRRTNADEKLHELARARFATR